MKKHPATNERKSMNEAIAAYFIPFVFLAFLVIVVFLVLLLPLAG